MDVFPLWPDDSVETSRDATGPTLEAFFPDTLSDAPVPAIVICPGGGYRLRAPHEGRPFARLFASAGIAAFVCQYRVAPNIYPAPFVDAARAIRMVRHRAASWRLDPERIAVMGFSAGGHLAAMVATRPNDPVAPDDDLAGSVSARPNRLVAGYPLISGVHDVNRDCFQNLLGKEPDDTELERFSVETWVTPDTPPTFLFHTSGDQIVRVSHSLRFAEACARAGVPFELHILPGIQHGIGMATSSSRHRPWTQWLTDWLLSDPSATP